MGGATLYHLARRGASVMGIEQFEIGHDRGSSHGRTRIFRRAYFEHPDYVPLLRTAYDLWEELAGETGRRLFDRTGLVQLGPPDGTVLPGILTSAATHNLPVEQLSAAEVTARWPGFKIPPPLTGLYEQAAGVLRVEPLRDDEGQHHVQVSFR